MFPARMDVVTDRRTGASGGVDTNGSGGTQVGVKDPFVSVGSVPLLDTNPVHLAMVKEPYPLPLFSSASVGTFLTPLPPLSPTQTSSTTTLPLGLCPEPVCVCTGDRRSCHVPTSPGCCDPKDAQTADAVRKTGVVDTT